jgi:hypothetical protein
VCDPFAFRKYLYFCSNGFCTFAESLTIAGERGIFNHTLQRNVSLFRDTGGMDQVNKGIAHFYICLLFSVLGLSCFIEPPPAPQYVITNGPSPQLTYEFVDSTHEIRILFYGAYGISGGSLSSNVIADISNNGSQSATFASDLIVLKSKYFSYGSMVASGKIVVKSHEHRQLDGVFRAPFAQGPGPNDTGIPRDEALTLNVRYVIDGKDTVSVEDIHFQVP